MYKIYKGGNDFILDNKAILDNDPIHLAFYFLDALEIKEFSLDNYIIKVYDDNNFLFMLKLKNYNLMIYGSKTLVNEAVLVLRDHNLSFTSLLCENELGEEFLASYQKIYKGSYKINLDMQLMKCDKLVEYDDSDVIIPDYDDFKEIYYLLVDFHLETNTRGTTLLEFKKQFVKEANNYRIIKANDEAVAVGKRRNVLNISSISCIYTNKKYRNRGYARMIVSALTKEIINEDKIPYLYVDRRNPISNQIYQSIGYVYLDKQQEFRYSIGNIKTLELAGGCFWCVAMPFYELAGVNRVLSGYIGGDKIDPEYIDVKTLKTMAREAILLEYDETKISYKELLDTYFDVIDPYDSDGQFIDRGYNYTCSIYSDVENVINYAKELISKYEKIGQKQVYVSLTNNSVFYRAEEYHQNYGLKNPEAMARELVDSGRKSNK